MQPGAGCRRCPFSTNLLRVSLKLIHAGQGQDFMPLGQLGAADSVSLKLLSFAIEVGPVRAADLGGPDWVARQCADELPGSG
jgi:hypothetical protein